MGLEPGQAEVRVLYEPGPLNHSSDGVSRVSARSSPSTTDSVDTQRAERSERPTLPRPDASPRRVLGGPPETEGFLTP